MAEAGTQLISATEAGAPAGPSLGGSGFLRAWTPAVLLALRLRGGVEAGLTAERLRQLTGQVLREALAEAARHTANPQDIADAEFAVVLLLDHSVYKAGGNAAAAWKDDPLEAQRMRSRDGGTEFYRRLQALRRRGRPAWPVLEVYHLCLLAGFEGEYAHQPGRREELLRELGRELATGADSTWADLFPGRPVEVPSPPAPPALLSPWWVALVAVVVVLVLGTVAVALVAWKMEAVRQDARVVLPAEAAP